MKGFKRKLELFLMASLLSFQSFSDIVIAEEATTEQQETTVVQTYCGNEEHEHTLSCYSDPNADVETEEDWTASFSEADLSGSDAENLISLAKTQLGYTESTKNYAVDEDGETIHGYTRYGAWAEDPYSKEWNTLFVAFCINYSGVNYLMDATASEWVEDLQSADTNTYWSNTEDWNPTIGDLVFFDTDEDDIADRVGIVESYTDTDITVIEGDVNRKVDEVTYDLSDQTILGYGLLNGKDDTTSDDSIGEDTNDGIMLAANKDSSEDTCGTINYYAFINGERKLWKTVTNQTVYYWSNNGRRYISTNDLEEIYGALGFKASMITDTSSYYFPHETTNASGKIWGDANMEYYNEIYYSPIVSGSTGNSSIDVYYLPNQSARSTSGDAWSNYTNSIETFYTITVSDPDHLVYGGTDQDPVPDVTYTQRGGTATMTVKNGDGVLWTCTDTSGNAVTGVDNNDGTTTFTISSISKAYTITPAYITYNLNLKHTPADEEYGTPTIGGSSTTYRDAIQAGDVFLTPSLTTYYYTHGTNQAPNNYRAWSTFLGWATSKDATEATYQAGSTIDTSVFNRDQTLYAVWKDTYGGNLNSDASVVNFFVALKAVPEGTTAWESSVSQSDFTKSVYAMDCGVTCDAVETYLNKNAAVKEGVNGQYIVLGGTSGDDLNAMHDEIVKKLTEGFTLQGSNNVNYTFKGIFPSDEEVLRIVRQMVANGTKITMNGSPVTPDALTAQNFTIKWHVFKTAVGDAWHIDGILVAKTGTLKVVKTFGGDETAVTEVKKNFEIAVDGTDTSLNNDTGTLVNKKFTLSLNSKDTETAENTVGYTTYDETTDTYTWLVKADQYYRYAVAENNYSYTDRGVTSVAEYEVYNSNNEDENTNDWQTYKGSATEIDVTITGQTYDETDTSSMQTVAFLNTYTEPGTLIVQKNDHATGNFLPGVQFQVSMSNDPNYDFQLYETSTGHYTSNLDNGQSGSEVKNNIVTTDQGGRVYLTLAQGTYYLYEQANNYDSPGRITVTVENGSEAGTVNKIVKITGASSVNKYGNNQDYVSYTDNTLILNVTNISPTTNVTVKKNWTDNENKQVTLQLFRNGTSLGSNYQAILNGRTDSKETTAWQQTFTGLPIYIDGAVAKYTIMETNIGGDTGFNYSSEYSDDGYKYYDVEMSSSTENGNIILTCSNNRSTAEVAFYKTDTNGKAIQGAEFYLYKLNSTSAPPASTDITFTPTELDDKNIYLQTLSDSDTYSFTASATSDANGKVSFGSKLADGYYYLIEHSTLRAYELAKDTLWLVRKDGSEVTISKRTETNSTYQWNALNEFKITNDDADLKASITLTKTDANTSAVLPGAEFTLRDAQGQYYKVTTVDNVNTVTWQSTENVLTTDTNGQLSITLPEGTYTLTETKPPDDYALLEQPITIVVSDDGQITECKSGTTDITVAQTQSLTGWTCRFNVTNTKAKSFTFYKVNKSDEKIEGALFGIYQQTCNDDHSSDTITINSDGSTTSTCWKLVATQKSNESGLVSFTGLPENKTYRLVEIQAVEEYSTPTGQWIVKDRDNTTTFTDYQVTGSVGNPPAFQLNENGTYSVRNYKIDDLPHAGSIGTKRFIIGGFILMLIGITFTIKNLHEKKDSNEQDDDLNDHSDRHTHKHVCPIWKRRKRL